MSRESHEALERAVVQLQSLFLQCRKEKGDLEQRMTELECRFSLYCRETNTIREYNALQHNQDATLKACSQENADYISWLEHKQGEMEVKLQEVQDTVPQLVGKYTECQGKSLASAESPFWEPAPAPPALQDFGAADWLTDYAEINLDDAVQPAQGQVMMRSPVGNPTGEKAEQLLSEMMKPQECAGLCNNPCMPFFYRAGRDKPNILVI